MEKVVYRVRLCCDVCPLTLERSCVESAPVRLYIQLGVNASIRYGISLAFRHSDRKGFLACEIGFHLMCIQGTESSFAWKEYHVWTSSLHLVCVSLHSRCVPLTVAFLPRWEAFGVIAPPLNRI